MLGDGEHRLFDEDQTSATTSRIDCIRPLEDISRMHAMVLTAPGAPLRFEPREDPAPGPGDVRVRVSACGVCRTDLHVTEDDLAVHRAAKTAGLATS